MTFIRLVAGKMGADQFLGVTMLGLCRVTLHRWGYGGGLFYHQKNMVPVNAAERFLGYVFCLCYVFFSSMFSTIFFYESYRPKAIKCYNEVSNKRKYYSAGFLSDHDPNHKHAPYSGSRGALASISVCVSGTFPWQLPSLIALMGACVLWWGTKKKGNVCVHTCIGGEGRGPGEGGGRQERKRLEKGGRPGVRKKNKHIWQVKVDLGWGGQMVCFKVQWIKALDVCLGKERPPTYQLHLSPTSAYIFLNRCKHIRHFSHRDINDAQS